MMASTAQPAAANALAKRAADGQRTVVARRIFFAMHGRIVTSRQSSVNEQCVTIGARSGPTGLHDEHGGRLRERLSQFGTDAHANGRQRRKIQDSPFYCAKFSVSDAHQPTARECVTKRSLRCGDYRRRALWAFG